MTPVTPPTEAEFEAIRQRVQQRAGLSWSAHCFDGAKGTIAKAMAAASCASAAEFLSRLDQCGDVLDALVDALTINETYFFRVPEQFDFIRDTVLPDLLRRRSGVRVWSAGCASGEEPYSLAILLKQFGILEQSEVLGTDISHTALERARRGVYTEWSLRDQGRRASAYLEQEGSGWQIAEMLRQKVRFERLNLALGVYTSAVNATSQLDLILCRNVLIYLTPQIIEHVAERLHDALSPGGWLLLGPSDPVIDKFAPFDTLTTPIGLIYRRKGGSSLNFPLLKRASFSTAPLPPTTPAAVGDFWWRNEAKPAWVLPPREIPVAEKPIKIVTPTPVPVIAPEALDVDCLALIREWANAGDVIRAERAAADVAAAEPLRIEVHFLRAVLLMSLDRFAEALDAVRRTIYLDHDFAPAHFLQGLLLEKSGRRAEARRAFENAASICAKLPPETVLLHADGEKAGSMAAAARDRSAKLKD